MKISIVISAYSKKRYDDLIELLENLRIQTYKDIEIIIIIDKDKELYDGIKNSYKHKDIKIKFNPENRGLSYSRNIGIRCATGDIISFIDDDAIPTPQWAEVIVNTFDGGDIGAVTGDVIPIWEFKRMSWFPNELHWMISCSYLMTPNYKCEIERGFGTNMSFKKDIIDKIGMFNTNLGINGKNWVGGEDTDMFLRVKDFGYKVIFDPNVKVYHKIYAHRVTIQNIIKRAFDGGFSLASMSKVRKYNIADSSENSYLKRLIFEFYPNKLKELVISPRIISKQITIVTLVILLEGIGYLYGKYNGDTSVEELIDEQNKKEVDDLCR